MPNSRRCSSRNSSTTSATIRTNCRSCSTLLNRTWDYWLKQGGKGPLGLEHYAAIGKMAEALNQHADEALKELPNERQKQICEKMFKALTDKAGDVRGVRRPTKVATLCALADANIEDPTSVVDVFSRKEPLLPDAADQGKAATRKRSSTSRMRA